MNLYFQRSNGDYLLIKENVADIDQAIEEVRSFCKRHDYISPYTRYWWHDKEQTVVTFDVGSYTEFFKLAKSLPTVGTEEDFIDRKQIDTE